MPAQRDVTLFGAELKRWRQHRRYSQLEVANRAEVSQRHLSFLETGRSRPSPEMVEHLSVVLDIPLRARNALFTAAGFAAAYTEEPLDGSALAQVRQGLETLVEAHDPYPAYVVDRAWNLLIANTAAVVLTGVLLPTEHALALGGNTLRLFLHPDGARNSVANWPEAAAVLLERFSAECAEDPGDADLAELLEEVSAYEGVDQLSPRVGRAATGGDLLTEVHVKTASIELRLYTTISSLAAPSDITLAGLRLETLLPADPDTAETLRTLRSGAA